MIFIIYLIMSLNIGVLNMHVSPINNYNSSLNSQQQASPSFGVKLVATQDVPKFVIKQAVNYAAANRLDPRPIVAMHYSALQKQFLNLAEIVKDYEPKNLEIRLGLNEKAKKYANDTHIDGKPFIGAPAQLSVDVFSKYEFSQVVDELVPTPDAFYRLKFNIREFLGRMGYNS